MSILQVVAVIALAFLLEFPHALGADLAASRERISLNKGWRFAKNDPPGAPADLSYDAIKKWILPTGNAFIAAPARRYSRPEGNPPGDISYTHSTFDDKSWRLLDLPHDWGVEGPFTSAGKGDTGRLPFQGVGWYRKKLSIPAADAGKSIFLDIDGAMSYAAVWLNGTLVGGWPYGYASWRLDLTPFIRPGKPNQLAIRLDNPPDSSRWYPGGGVYRNVWLVKTRAVHVSHWGTTITTPEIASASASIRLSVAIDNDSAKDAEVRISTEIFALGAAGTRVGAAVARIPSVSLLIPAKSTTRTETQGRILRPRLWGPPPEQKPHRYVAITTLMSGARMLDRYETAFGVRTLKFDPNEGFFINGKHVKLNGVCNHHDLGALGAALNRRALERQLEMLVDMGANAIRTSHNPPAPELLDLADEMGLMVMDETFDTWRRPKTPNDYARLFDEWREQDVRMLVRRDRNHPSVIMWSIGNEVAEQGLGADGAAVAKELADIVREEDPTRPTAGAMNTARAGSPFPVDIDTAGLNYQGAGRSGLQPQYPVFHENYPTKFVFGSETASTVSSRGEYVFPVAPTDLGAVAGPESGQNAAARQMSSYDLYFPFWAASPDREFEAQERYPFVGGEFVWTGWDYLGEPTPFDASRSSYFGIIDLAGFKKDRFYLYQSRWRPDLPMAHILPHWNWPERVGLKGADGNPVPTPVHVYTSGDEAELFLNGRSLGRKKREAFQYRLRWDDVIYEPGELRVVAYRAGKRWATDAVKTTGEPAGMILAPDRTIVANDGSDLAFVTLTIIDKDGAPVPRAHNAIRFSAIGSGEIVATDNGDPTDFTVFASKERKAFNGKALVIVKGNPRGDGTIIVTATSEGLPFSGTQILSKPPRPRAR